MEIDNSGIGIKSLFSFRHLRNARRTAITAAEIEQSWHGPGLPDEAVLGAHEDLVISSVISSVAFLEATVNEIFSDAVDGVQPDAGGTLEGMSERAVRQMAGWWEAADRRESTLAMYQMLLLFNDREPLDRGGDPYQSAAATIDLRNSLVHFHPTTIYDSTVHTLEKKLKGRFEVNSLRASTHTNWWPYLALSAGCAEWCCAAVEAFAGGVADEIGFQPFYRLL